MKWDLEHFKIHLNTWKYQNNIWKQNKMKRNSPYEIWQSCNKYDWGTKINKHINILELQKNTQFHIIVEYFLKEASQLIGKKYF